MAYKTIIGLEIHAELKTKTKMFCGCKNEFGATPNTNVCEICLGHPGAKSTLNEKCVEFGIMAGLSLNCKINKKMQLDRKRYFYPDLVKGYQISQDKHPICYDGFVEINDGKESINVGIERIQIEEDTAKSVHTDNGLTLVDYNRSGVPLIEIVTKPDIKTPEQGRLFLNTLKDRLKYIGISDVKMEEGSLRCDVNINVVDLDSGKKTAITEVKNLNSFKAAEKAMEYESERHIDMLKSDMLEKKSTRRWNEEEQKTVLMRLKSESSDYKFSMELDVPYLELSDDFILSIKSKMDELPSEKSIRFVNDYKIEKYDADIISQNKFLSNYFEKCCKLFNKPKNISNWILSDLLRRVNEAEIEIEDIPVNENGFTELLKLIDEGKINNNAAKKVLREMFEKSLNDPLKIINSMGLMQISDDNMLLDIINEVLSENPNSITDFKAGKDRALGYLVGQAMKKSKGKGNPQKFNKLISEKLNG